MDDNLRKEASAYLADAKENGEPGYAYRSCWECNPAHEHLKEAEMPILCNSCGNWFFKGVKA